MYLGAHGRKPTRMGTQAEADTPEILPRLTGTDQTVHTEGDGSPDSTGVGSATRIERVVGAFFPVHKEHVGILLKMNYFEVQINKATL